MSLNAHRKLFLVLFCTSCSFGPFIGKAQEKTIELPMKRDTLQRDYANLGVDWRRKRSLCINLIDQGVIDVGAKLKPVLSLFGDDVYVIQG